MGALQRILFGTAPIAFLGEVLVRTATVYLVLVVMVRLLGKRMSGQISNIELAVMIALGAIVSGAFQMPDRGVLPAFVLMLTLLALQRGVSAAGARSRRVERGTQGGCKMIVSDGRLQLHELREIGLSHDQVYAALRGLGVQHLGQVRRLYLEVSGVFSIYRRQPSRPGLCVLPSKDEPLRQRLPPAANVWVCSNCGALARSGSAVSAHCERCGRRSLEPAVLEEQPGGGSGETRDHAA